MHFSHMSALALARVEELPILIRRSKANCSKVENSVPVAGPSYVGTPSDFRDLQLRRFGHGPDRVQRKAASLGKARSSTIIILCGIAAVAIASHSTLMVRRLSTNRVHIVRRNSPTLATIIVVRTLSWNGENGRRPRTHSTPVTIAATTGRMATMVSKTPRARICAAETSKHAICSRTYANANQPGITHKISLEG